MYCTIKDAAGGAGQGRVKFDPQPSQHGEKDEKETKVKKNVPRAGFEHTASD